MKPKMRVFQGIWPYSADPGPVGQIDKSLPTEWPVLLAGNSRHTLVEYQKTASSLCLRIVSVDTGGLDLPFALKEGRLSLNQIGKALAAAPVAAEFSEDQPENAEGIATARAVGSGMAFLPYPTWIRLQSKGRLPGCGGTFELQPCPADLSKMALFLEDGNHLAEAAKQGGYPLDERFSIALAQGGLLILIAAIPLIFTGWTAFGAGALLVLLHQILLPVLYPSLACLPLIGLKKTGFTLAGGLLCMAVAILLSLPVLSAALVGTAWLVLSAWLQFLFKNWADP